MEHALRVDPRDAAPIWSQIEHGVRRLVAAGALAAGAPMPSVRELARELRVNPATVAKAYQRLCDAGVLAVRRGEGTFVAEHPPRMAAEARRRLLSAEAMRYVAVARTSGAERDESVGAVEAAWQELATGRKGGER